MPWLPHAAPAENTRGAVVPGRPASTLLALVLLWAIFYASFTLGRPALLDDADSVHAEVAREMLVRHDDVTLYANGIRYLEKAPLLYWSMAGSMELAASFGAWSPEDMAAAVRVPLALTVLALALLCESLARRMFVSARAGLYAGLGVLSSFGIFLFTRITIPDAMVCLWVAAALWCFWRTEELGGSTRRPGPPGPPGHTEAQQARRDLRRFCWAFAACCAANVLTKGLIGVVFPVLTVLLYLYLARGRRKAWRRLRALFPWSSLAVFLLLAAPWHILAGLHNPTQGHPAPFGFADGHPIVPLPTDGNVRGWFWFYFVNEHLLRYLNLRVPHDYDTAPLWLFWGLCFVWLMPWSAFVFKAVHWALPWTKATDSSSTGWERFRRHDLPLRQRGLLLLLVWAAVVLLFFSLSTRQEYYVLPALPALSVLIAGWLRHVSAAMPHLTRDPDREPESERDAARERTAAEAQDESSSALRRAYRRCLLALTILGGAFALASIAFLLKTHAPAAGTDLATLLAANPADYALSLGHFLDLNANALGLFRLPLALAALSLFGGPLTALLFSSRRRRNRIHRANLALAAGAFGFLLAAHLGLQRFAPVLSSAQLAEAIQPQVRPDDLVVLHGEYESGSTLGFYLRRSDLHILEGRSSNLWYGSFFPDAPKIFETPESLRAKWAGPQRVFLWQSLTDEPRTLPPVDGPVYVLARGGGKEIVSNQPNGGTAPPPAVAPAQEAIPRRFTGKRRRTR